jgi:hypothetical protein
MLKRLLTIIVISLGLLAPVGLAVGQAAAVSVVAGCSGQLGATDVCKEVNKAQGSATNPVISVIKAAISIIAYVIGVAAVVGVIVSGIRLVTSGGDAGSVATARSGLIFSLVGIMVAIFAQLIVVFILSKIQ